MEGKVKLTKAPLATLKVDGVLVKAEDAGAAAPGQKSILDLPHQRDVGRYVRNLRGRIRQQARREVEAELAAARVRTFPVTTQQLDERDAAAAEREAKRVADEQRAKRRERIERQLAAIRAGEFTEEEKAAIARIRVVRTASKGRWTPRGELSMESQALEKVVAGVAREAVLEYLRPLLAEAEDELAAATAARPEAIKALEALGEKILR